MISVRNHPPRLSGSKQYIVWDTVRWQLPLLRIDNFRLSLVRRIALLLLAVTGHNIPYADATAFLSCESAFDFRVFQEFDQKVDTIPWSSDPNAMPAIQDRDENEAVDSSPRKTLRILLLIPLNSDEVKNAASSRFVNYYAGILMAVKQMEKEGINIHLTVVDTEENNMGIDSLVRQFDALAPDMVIGPYKKENIQKMAAVCKEKKVPLVSPWHTSSKITTDNPYYIQLKPNVKQHYNKIIASTAEKYNTKDVYILGLESDEFTSWTNYFQSRASELTGIESFYNVHNIPKDSLMKGPSAFVRFIKRNRPKAVVIPYYHFKDEEIAYQIVKRLASDKGEYPLAVYGMPLLFESEKITFDQYHTLVMRIVMSDYIDDRQPEIRDFRRTYLNRFGEIPTNEAVKGYEVFTYLARSLSEHGRGFTSDQLGELIYITQLSFELQESFSDPGLEGDNPTVFDFYESNHLDIIEFSEKRWIRK